jgi:2-dehydro-3-deoxygluconokinase
MNDTLSTNNGKKICCFGELLMRFSPELQGGFISANTMPVYIGGAELNVTTALAKWNLPVKYVTAIPDHYLSNEIVRSIADKNIDTTNIRLSGERIGTYYLPQGADLKHNGVIYDRKYSSFAALKPGDLDWKDILKDVDWFHFSAINPALNEDAAAVCLEAVQVVSSMNITISVDLNYRAKLWQYGKQPGQVMPELAQYCDVMMGNVWAAEQLLNIPTAPGFDPVSGDRQAYLHQAALTSAAVRQRFPKCRIVANTFRFDEGEGIRYFAALAHGDDHYHSHEYTATAIVDKVGSGDCFMAGLIYGLYKKISPPQIIEYAAAAAFAKLQQQGDTTTSTEEAIQQLIEKNG